MADKMDIDPAVLRELAKQHDAVAADAREWAKQPTEWLNSFLDTYGKIAQPVHNALLRYYDAREKAGNALAGEHDDTAANLRASADEYERFDQDIAQQIGNAGDNVDGRPAPMQPAGMQPSGEQPVGAQPTTNGNAPVGATPAPVGAPVGGPSDAGPGGPGGAPSESVTPLMPTTGPEEAGPSAPPAATGPDQAAQPLAATTGPGMMPGGSMFGPGEERGHAGTSGRSGGFGPDGGFIGAPMGGPLAGAVNATRAKEAPPSHVVGEEADGDLLLAKTVLAGILAAADTPVVGLQWAVSVMRGPGGVSVFVTTNEGRGWLPAGLRLPEQVELPWSIDMAASLGGAESAWEGVSDPARVLVEFGKAWAPGSGAELTAVASSDDIDAALRGQIRNVPTASNVAASPELDLGNPGIGILDRLGITSAQELVERAERVPEDRILEQCLEMAWDGHLRAGRGGTPPSEAMDARNLRQRILTAIGAGEEVPPEWFEELRDADDLIGASMIGHRTDPRRVEVGALRVHDDAEKLRALVFERRCDEMVLLMQAGQASRQVLRDVVYAHSQVVDHPAFTIVPVGVAAAATDDRRVSAPSVSAPATAAPPASAGRGAVAPPTTAGTPPGIDGQAN